MKMKKNKTVTPHTIYQFDEKDITEILNSTILFEDDHDYSFPFLQSKFFKVN